MTKWAFEDESDVSDFHTRLSEPALTYPFELDVFQKRAVLHVDNHESVFVAAHTSAGKTVIAEYAIAAAMQAGDRAIYTSPIKALSNQKFRDFKKKFGSVGIITGDVRVEPEAACLIMTTEILRSMLYRNDELLDTVKWVIFDEVHYLNDSERGYVYEECIIMLPPRVSVVMLSATVPNYMVFAEWVGRTRGRPVFCVKTDWRPVPLKFHFFLNEKVYPLTTSEGKFDAITCKKAYEDAEIAKAKNKKPRNADQKERTEHQRLYHFLMKLSADDLLPAAVFVFSRVKCEQLASGMTSLDLLTQSEKSQVHLLFKKALAGLSESDWTLPQIVAVTELASRGIGVHHGGLLPIMKEATEMLFSRGLIKVLFATETFAMGINMPTRTVIYSSLRKHDGGKFRYLLPTEFTQMSGRAGRRGLDTVGTVFIFAATEDNLPEYQSLLGVMTKKSGELRSQFRLTFQMLLQLSRVSHLSVEDMLGRSYMENHRAASAPGVFKELEDLRFRLHQFDKVSCAQCDHETLEKFHADEMLTANLSASFASSFAKKKDLFKFGRLLRVFIDNGYPSEPAIVLDQSALDKTGKVQVRTVSDSSTHLIPIERIQLICDSVVIDTDSVEANDTRFLQPAQLGKLSVDDYELFDKLKRSVIHQLSSPCFNCPDLRDHFVAMKVQYDLAQKVAHLSAQVDEKSMMLIPQRQAMQRVLLKLGYIDDDLQLTFKGKAAVEVLNGDELTLTEIIFENIINDSLDIPTIVALVSAFVAGNDGTPELNFKVASRALAPEIVQKLHEVAKVHREVVEKALKLEKVQVNWDEFDKQVCFGMAPVAYEWASGRPFADIMSDRDLVSPDGDKQLQEGAIARVMVRTDELLRKIILGMNVIGSDALAVKIEKCREAIRRDIAFGMSLYLRSNDD